MLCLNLSKVCFYYTAKAEDYPEFLENILQCIFQAYVFLGQLYCVSD